LEGTQKEALKDPERVLNRIEVVSDYLLRG
jgi:hypothetical protein